MNPDPGSLDRLHGPLIPPPAPWWPPTPGWTIVLTALALFLAAALLKLIVRWQADRYRREALALLPSTPPEQLAALLKRTAMTAWPRDRTADLTGEAWLEFLDRSGAEGEGGLNLFVSGPARRIEALAFDPAAKEDVAPIRDAARQWIRKHRREAEKPS